MANTSTASDKKSLENLAFVHWLRTGQSLSSADWDSLEERKYNHNHDELGKFTFSGSGSIAHSATFHSWAAHPGSRQSGAPAPRHRTTATTPAVHPASAPHPAGHSAVNPVQAAHLTSPSPFTQVGSHPARIYRTRAGAAIIDPRSGRPMLVPEGVSIRNTIRVARIFSSPLNRDAAAASAFTPGASMDFQRTHSTLRDRHGETLIDQRFIAIGNYNFGVYAAASGMPLDRAFSGAAKLYFWQTWKTSGNPRNESLIASGYRDYMSGNVGN